MKIIKQRTTEYVEHFLLCFSYGKEGRGFSFECDEKGNVDESKLGPCALANYKECLSGTIIASPMRHQRIGANGEYENIPGCSQQVSYKLDHEVRDFGKHVNTPAVGECNRCGGEVILQGDPCTCECGMDYNSAGQELAPRSQWGEETGETAADILRGGDMFEGDY